MLSLTPLHHQRTKPTETDSGSVIYGNHRYVTDCGRFFIIGYQQQWYIGPSYIRYQTTDCAAIHLLWQAWLNIHGLYNVGFATRREALHTLAAAIAADEFAQELETTIGNGTFDKDAYRVEHNNGIWSITQTNPTAIVASPAD